ncbi:MAG: hypothetical protein IPO19_00130 [Rhodoferax sp.]|nr:hypothetical protein [Rhodoferax sp.]
MATRPLVLLVLGQSNAANHGALREQKPVALPVVLEEGCALATDPLPGATGRGGSIWSALPQALEAAGVDRRNVVFSVLAVDATSIADWTSPDSPLRQRLVQRLAALKRIGLMPDLVLWQQGEADARLGTDPMAYAAALQQLRTLLDAGGSQAPCCWPDRRCADRRAPWVCMPQSTAWWKRARVFEWARIRIRWWAWTTALTAATSPQQDSCEPLNCGPNESNPAFDAGHTLFQVQRIGAEETSTILRRSEPVQHDHTFRPLSPSLALAHRQCIGYAAPCHHRVRRWRLKRLGP